MAPQFSENGLKVKLTSREVGQPGDMAIGAQPRQ